MSILIRITEKDTFITQMIADGDTAFEVAKKTGASQRTIEARIMRLKNV